MNVHEPPPSFHSFLPEFSSFQWWGCIWCVYNISASKPSHSLPLSFLILSLLALFFFLKSRCTIKKTSLNWNTSVTAHFAWVALVSRVKSRCLSDNVLSLLWYYYVMSVATERRRRRGQLEGWTQVWTLLTHGLRRRLSACGATSLYSVLEHVRPLVYILVLAARHCKF